MPPSQQCAELICETGRLLHARGFIVAAEGNISCRLNDSEILCTPTWMAKQDLTPDELCVVDLDGTQRRGQRAMTSEIELHLELYRNDPGTSAVVHCHPPHATAFAISKERLRSGLLAEAEYYLGEIPTIEYRMPGTQALARLIAPHATSARCAILKNHGAVSWALDLERARWWMEVLDAYCRTLILSRNLGPLDPLPDDQIAKLRSAGALHSSRDTP